MASLPDPTAHLSGEGHVIYEDILKRRAAKGVHHLGPYIPLLNHPQLAKRIEQLGYYYKYEATLPRDVYQFLVLTFSKHAGIAFEWADHVDAARKSGLPDDVITAIAEGTRTFPEPYDAVRECMGCALEYKSIPEALQNKAVALFGLDGLIEIVTLCGFYGMIGMVNVCFDVPLPPAQSK